MVFPVRSLLVAFLVVSTSLAGCLGSMDESAGGNETDIKSTVSGNDNETFVNPDGSKSAAANETNKTVVGKGGIEHVHDYWGGEQSKVIYDENVWLNDPMFCDNKDTSKLGCAIIRLPVTDPAVLVYEGTARVEIVVTSPGPGLQGLQMRYRNGANPIWGDLIDVAPGTPTFIDITPIETDMPHASSSQWSWKFVGNRNVAPSPLISLAQVPDFHLTIIVHKGAKIVDWPGHPDFYADKPYRVVMEREATTKTVGAADSIVYGDEASIIRPDLLISSGTGKISVYINITSVNSPGIQPNRYILEYTNATGDWYNDYRGPGRINRVWGNVTEPEKSYVMDIPVKYTGWDSPYAPVSGWQFRVIALYGTIEDIPAGPIKGIGFCPGCYPYDITYQIKVIAYPDPQYVGTDALE